MFHPVGWEVTEFCPVHSPLGSLMKKNKSTTRPSKSSQLTPTILNIEHKCWTPISRMVSTVVGKVMCPLYTSTVASQVGPNSESECGKSWVCHQECQHIFLRGRMCFLKGNTVNRTRSGSVFSTVPGNRLFSSYCNQLLLQIPRDNDHFSS